ncbi:hypothetical protein AYI69_g5342 [Smittium culicis]|uniref:Uncharacterized protein n=1 Tax=Smittium culicis TaxID=133412 RepID=A0A1R1XT29_9FUNG|nr:hypothetical protein AYI69_g7328 [Smittium culicis]OMJ22556.1 hypothetical protein AYI69_g5342 [Smittium culicis]
MKELTRNNTPKKETTCRKTEVIIESMTSPILFHKPLTVYEVAGCSANNFRYFLAIKGRDFMIVMNFVGRKEGEYQAPPKTKGILRKSALYSS